MTHRIDISYRTVLFIAGFILTLWLLYLIRDILLLLFVAFIFVSALTPAISRLQSWKIPKVLATFIVFFLSVGLLITLLTIGFTPLISQTRSLADRLTDVIGALIQANFIDQSVISQELSNLSGQVVQLTLSLFQNLIAFVSLIVITFYLALDREKIEERTISLFSSHQEKVRKLIDKIEEKLGAWMRGQLILSGLIGVLVYIGLTILGIDYALPLAILAAILEIVPVLGPIISAIPAVLLALTISPVFAAVVAGFYLFIQQIEGHIVVPQVMRRAVGLNPILVILAISIGGRLLGIAGALLAVPLTVVIQIILEEVLKVPEAEPQIN